MELQEQEARTQAVLNSKFIWFYASRQSRVGTAQHTCKLSI